MNNFIKKLHDQTENLKISVTNGYPRCIGIRSIDPIIIDDVVNLIYGRLTYRAGDGCLAFHNINEIMDLDNPSTFNLNIGSQIIVYGHIIQIDLGKYIIDDMNYDEKSDRIVMNIHRDHH